MKHKYYIFGKLLLGFLIFFASCTPPLNKHVTIKLSECTDSTQVIDQKTIDNTVDVIKARLKLLKLFFADEQIVSNANNQNEYIIKLPERVSNEQIQLLFSETSQLEIWKFPDNFKIQNIINIALSDTYLQQMIQISPSSRENSLYFANDADSALIMQTLEALIINKNIQLRWAKDNKQANAPKSFSNKILYFLEKKDKITGPLLTSEFIKKVYIESSPYISNPSLSIQLNVEGAEKWQRITEENVKKQLAILIDNEVYLVAIVNDKVTSGGFQISGNLTQHELEQLKFKLQAEKIPLCVTIKEIIESKE